MTKIISIGDAEYKLLEKISTAEDNQVADILFREEAADAASFRMFLQQEGLMDDPDAETMLRRLEELEAQRAAVPTFSNDVFVQYMKARRVDVFEDLFKLHFDPLLSYVSSHIKNIDAAEDVVQVAFIRIWKKLESIQSPAHFKNELFSIAKDVIDATRREKESEAKRKEVFKSDLFLNLVENDAFLEAENIIFFANAISELSGTTRSVVESLLKGMTIKETAEELNLAQKTVRDHQVKAQNILRKKWEARPKKR